MKKSLAIILTLVMVFGLLVGYAPVSAQGVAAERHYYISGVDSTKYFITSTGSENEGSFPQELASEPSSKDIDGNLDDWNESELVAFNNISLYAGADLWKLYVSADRKYLYIAITTKNNESWDLLYEIAFDFITKAGTKHDPWRVIGFSNYTPDYILAFHWKGQTNGVDYVRFYNGIQDWWSYPDDIKYNYIASNGLQTMEIAIPWQKFDGIHPNLRVMAWIAGEYPDSSAVESIPDDPAVHNSDNEWNDHDDLANFAEVSLSIDGVETWNGDWTQVGGEFYVDHPIIVAGHVELHNVTIVFNGSSISDSLIQVDGGLKIYNSRIMGNRIDRMISLGDYLIIEGSKLLDMDEIKLVGSSVFRSNNLTWEFDVWEPPH